MSGVATRSVRAVTKMLKNVKPQVGIVLGSGMGAFAESSIQDPISVPYSDIPDFPVSTVSGHAGRLVVGTVKGVRVACFQGRVHLYEGVDPQQLRIPMYLLKGMSFSVFDSTSLSNTITQVSDAKAYF